MDGLHKQAHVLRKQGMYKEAVEAFEKAWTKDNKNKWLGWEYAFSLKKIGEVNKAITICKHTYSLDKRFTLNNDLMAWCVYEKYFRDKNKSFTFHEIDKLEKIALTIISLIEQKPGSAYEYIIFALVSILKNQVDKRSHVKVIEWLERLDVRLLTNDISTYVNKKMKGNVLELPSRKEEYYSIKTRSLMKLNKYRECIDCCVSAESEIEIYHYNNDIWIKKRRFSSLGRLGEYETAISGLKDLLLHKEHWTLFFEIAELYEVSDQRNLAIHYAYKALLTRDPDKMKINVIYFIAEKLAGSNECEISNKHYAYYRKIKEENDWSIPLEVQSYISTLDDCYEEISHKEMQKIWLKAIKDREKTHNGKVSKIMNNKRNGFIQFGKNSVFFKTYNVFGRKSVNEKDNVTFIIEDSYDFSKKKNTKEAKYIEVI